MPPGVDAEKRQRLFEAWTAGLALPLREDPRILSLTRWVEADATSLILLESDEPLPFSRDVCVSLSRRNKIRRPPLPFDPPTRRAEAAEPAVPDLELDDDRFIAPPLPPSARGARRILRAVAVEGGRVEVEVFEIDRSDDGLLANRVPTRLEWPRELSAPQPGELVFVDDQNRSLFPPIPPFDIFIWSPVLTMVLANGDETRTLIIPAGSPIAAGSCRLHFKIDRRRWRVAAPDATSNYRVEAKLLLTWT